MSATRSPAPGLRSPRRRRLLPGLAVLALLVAVVAVTSLPGIRRGLIDPAGRDPQVGVTEVEVRDDFWEYFAFTPSVVQVEPGTEVTWTFASRTAHNVVFEDVASPTHTTGAWSRTFDEPGSYPYLCSLHDGMEGRVEVVAP